MKNIHDKGTHLKVWSERIWKPHVPWESTENQVTELDTVSRDHIAKPVMVIAQELRKVMQKYKQETKSALKVIIKINKQKSKAVTKAKIQTKTFLVLAILRRGV